jgi:YVTN family beta-propeller protein
VAAQKICGNAEIALSPARQGGIKVSPDGTHVFVTNFEGDKVTIVDAASRKVIRALTGFSKKAIVFSHGQNRANVLNRDLSVARVNVEDLSIMDAVRE